MENLRTHFFYWILPTMVTLLCILVYFYNFFGGSELISSGSNREFGILEHLQLLLILFVIVIAVKAVRIKQVKPEKYLFIFIALFAFFFFLEEIDYGLHYYEIVTGSVTQPEIRNVHNNGKITSVFKMGAYIVIVVFFIILPLIPKNTKEKLPFLDYLSPSKMIIITTICLFLINEFAFFLFKQNFHTNRSLDGNISEFEELMTYYIVMLYIKELAGNTKKLTLSFGSSAAS